MDKWLDSLSEDWVSEPRSSNSNSNIDSAPSPGNSSPKGSLSQSRIPRYNPRSTSQLSVTDNAAQTRKLPGQVDGRTTLALHESSSSNLNASQAQGLRRISKPSSPLVPRPSGERVRSASSLSHVAQDTVQHKPSRSSPAKDSNLQNTPDWKRRIIQGKVAPGEKCDLFSPIGLEKVFRPPNSGPRVKHGRGFAAKRSQPEEYPSSPPQYPSASNEKLDIPSDDRELSKTPVLPTKGNAKSERDLLHQGRAVGSREADGDDSNKQRRILSTPRGIRSRPHSAKAHSSKSGSVKREGRLMSTTATAETKKSDSNTNNQIPKISPNSSMQRDLRDENLSPFFISRHQTLDGRVDYAALDMSMSQLRCQMDKLRLRQHGMPSPRSSDYGIDYSEAKSPGNSSLPEYENDWTSQSLPDDLSMGTDAFIAHGGFVNMRRGGYSHDGSFQRRPLSPSSQPALDASEPRSVAPSGKFGRSGKPAVMSPRPKPELPLSAPATPRREPNEPSSPPRTQSSGSPLKLFDKYDTFTNDRLSRRINKFEENMRESPKQEIAAGDHENTGLPSKRPRDSTTEENQVPSQSCERSQTRLNSFGEGKLDNHSFCSSHLWDPSLSPGRGDSLASCTHAQRDSYVSPLNPEHSPKSPNPSPTKRNDLGKAPVSISQDSIKAITYHDPNSASTTNGGKPSTSRDHETPEEDIQNAQGKRLPRSPIKDSQPKRRRTLMSSEEAHSRPKNHSPSVEAKRPVMNSVVGRKRKDALYDGQNQVADPETLAMRTILRPRTSTTSNNETHDRGVSVDTLLEPEGAQLTTLELVPDPSLQQDPPTEAVAKELARFTFDTVQDIKGSRKVSVSTADFFSEAQQIMRVIRAQGRPQSSPNPLQESEEHHLAVFEDSVLEESLKEEFSRPPSRAGGSLRRLREPVQFDARVISHLRKFEEKGDLEMAFPSSLKSVQLDRSESEHVDAKIGRNNLNDENSVQCDPPNVRIHSQLPPQGSRKRSPMENPPSLMTDTKARSLGSPTSGPSTGRSLHTGSSLGSGTKATIVPETVSHLLPDQIAGMKYDQERQVWIKIPAKESLKTPYQTSSETTEDALGNIPDLSVDELEEMQRIKDYGGSFKTMGSVSNGVSNHNHPTHEDKQFVPNEDEGARPRTAEGAISASEEDSSARSKYSRFASSGPIPETRATSWGADASPTKDQGLRRQGSYTPTAEDEDDREEEVEHEISILEGRSSKTPTRPMRKDHQARVVTVSFSSPLVGQMQTPYPPEDEPDLWADGSHLDLDDSPIRFSSKPGALRSKRRSSFDGRTSRRPSSRRVSINSQSYLARPMSRLDEEDEIAFLHQSSYKLRNASMDMVLTTPIPPQGSVVPPQPPPSGQHSSVGFHLSPLPDFSIHQTDDSSNQGHGDLVRRRGLLAAHEAQKYALVTQHLVKKLTDLEPYEPHWDLIESMNLQNQGLATLHKLDEFCGRLEELDVSNNCLDQLDGAPSSIRDLKVSRNHLSDLSAWGHLHNLQYLDVSRNHIHTFSGLQHLVHLRELKADDNEIESLHGLLQLDGLLSLRLRGNLVKSVDFQGSNL